MNFGIPASETIFGKYSCQNFETIFRKQFFIWFKLDFANCSDCFALAIMHRIVQMTMELKFLNVTA